MTAESGLDGQLDAKDFAEVLKMLQEGENTASSLEKKLDGIEKGLDDLLAQIDAKAGLNEVSDGVAKTAISEDDEKEKP
ncbi:hypothetical protein MOSE0_B04896 [Monosporozyma servazzii]